MRVVLLGKYYHPYMGGIESHLRVITSELKQELDIEVVVSNTGRRTVHDVVDGVPVTRVASFGKVASVALTPTLPLELSRRDYDVMHVHLPNPGGVASYLASMKPRHHRLVISYHADVYRQRVLVNLYQPFLERALARADVVIATSPQLLENSPVLTRYREKCRIVPYGIDLERFSKAEEHAQEAARIRARYGGGPLLLGVGRLIYYKGYDIAIRAMREVPNARLLIVGDGPLRADLEALAREQGVADRVILVGEVLNERVTPYYLASDVYLLPSIARSEAFGIVQIEAMACGVPVINTHIPSGVPFVSLHEQTGLTVPIGDATALAAAINRLLGDPELRRRMGEAGRRRASEHFSKAVLRERLLAAYQGRDPV